jgi:hypothetical protein
MEGSFRAPGVENDEFRHDQGGLPVDIRLSGCHSEGMPVRGLVSFHASQSRGLFLFGRHAMRSDFVWLCRCTASIVAGVLALMLGCSSPPDKNSGSSVSNAPASSEAAGSPANTSPMLPELPPVAPIPGPKDESGMPIPVIPFRQAPPPEPEPHILPPLNPDASAPHPADTARPAGTAMPADTARPAGTARPVEVPSTPHVPAGTAKAADTMRPASTAKAAGTAHAAEIPTPDLLPPANSSKPAAK